MANFEEMIAKLNGIGQRKQEEAENEHFKRAQTIVEYENKVIALAPRIKKLMEIAKAMLASGVPFGKQTKALIGYKEEFISQHNLGFFFEGSRRDTPLLGIGIRECNDYPMIDLLVNEFGEIVREPNPHKVSYNYDGYYDFCKEYKLFLDGFDGFERRVYEYVDSL